MSNDDLEEGDGEFTTNFDNPMEGDSASIILELLKKAVSLMLTRIVIAVDD